MTAPALAGVSYARMYCWMWIVDCVCRSALRVKPGQRWWQCWDCGAWADIAWPHNLDDIAYLLALRPDPKTRNWFPGETLADLLEQNVTHGIAPPLVPGLPPGVSFLIRGDRIGNLGLAPAPRRPGIGR